MKRKSTYVVLAMVGTLALLFAGLSGASVVFAQEETPESDEAPACPAWNWGRGLFGPGLFGRGPGGDWTMFDTAADVLDLTPEELFSQLHDGKSLEEIAEDAGVDLETLRETLDAARDGAMRERIEQAVADGVLSQDEADWLLEGLDKGYMPRGGFRRGGRRPGMRGGFHKFGPQSEPSDTRAPSGWRSSSL